MRKNNVGHAPPVLNAFAVHALIPAFQRPRMPPILDFFYCQRIMSLCSRDHHLPLSSSSSSRKRSSLLAENPFNLGIMEERVGGPGTHTHVVHTQAVSVRPKSNYAFRILVLPPLFLWLSLCNVLRADPPFPSLSHDDGFWLQEVHLKEDRGRRVSRAKDI